MDEWADIVIEYSDEDEGTIEKIKEKVINSKGKNNITDGETATDPVTGQPIPPQGYPPMAYPPFNMFAPTPLSMAANAMSQDTINMCMGYGSSSIPNLGGINIQAGGDVTINIGNVDN